MLGTRDLVAIDLAGGAVLLNLGSLIAGQIDVLLNGYVGLSISEMVVNPILKHDSHEGQSVERSRANDVDARGGVESDLNGDSVIALHLLGGKTRRLRRNFQN